MEQDLKARVQALGKVEAAARADRADRAEAVAWARERAVGVVAGKGVEVAAARGRRAAQAGAVIEVR